MESKLEVRGQKTRFLLAMIAFSSVTIPQTVEFKTLVITLTISAGICAAMTFWLVRVSFY